MSDQDVLKAAVAQLNADPAVPHNDLEVGQLLDFRIYADRVSVVIATGQKYTVNLADLAGYLVTGTQKVIGGRRSKLPDNTLKQ